MILPNDILNANNTQTDTVHEGNTILRKTTQSS